MRKRHVADTSTIEALQIRRNGSLRRLARSLGFDMEFASTLSAILAGKPGYISQETENELRLAMGLPAIGTVYVAACPSCGGAHVLADCHGAPVAAVVALAPGETVRRPAQRSRTRRHYLRPCLSLDPITRAAQLRALLAAAEAEEMNR